MTKETNEKSAPKKRTRKAAARRHQEHPQSVPTTVDLPWKPGGLYGAPLALDPEIMNGDVAIMCARLTFHPDGSDCWVMNPHFVTEHGMLADAVIGSRHPWRSVSAWCSLDALNPDEDSLRKMV